MVRLRIKNLDAFAAQIQAGAKNLAKETFRELSKDAEKFFRGVSASVENSKAYQDLKLNSKLRGKLGLATKALRVGGDTDAKDLLIELRKLKIQRTKTGRSRKFKVSLPSLAHLEKKLTHSRTTVDKGSIKSGPIFSWFRWWEFGDRGEINSLTILRQTISKLVSKSAKNKKSRTALLQILKNRSRSGSAIQIRDRSPDQNSSIQATGLVGKTYDNFARIFPAVMAKSLRRLIRKHGGRAEKLFAKRGA